jgi:hypothetical protein
MLIAAERGGCIIMQMASGSYTTNWVASIVAIRPQGIKCDGA